MSLATNIQNLATRVATECKSIRTLLNGNAADLSSLTTSAKTNLVAAVNELKAAIDALSAGGGAAIDDASTGTATTWSSQKVSDSIAAAVTNLVNGSPGALDTLKELADAIGDDANFASTVTTALGNRLRFDAVQTLTAAQKTQGQSNLDVYAKADIGDPTTNFVTTFETGLT